MVIGYGMDRNVKRSGISCPVGGNFECNLDLGKKVRSIQEVIEKGIDKHS